MNPRCGALIKSGCFLRNTPPPLLLLQLSNFLLINIKKGTSHLVESGKNTAVDIFFFLREK